MTDIKKLNSIAIKDEKWLQEAKNRQLNKEWQSHSRKIASKILVTLREKGMKQNQLAKIIGVSAQQVNKIIKGRENLTLETISKLESALEIKLLFNEHRTNHLLNERIENTQYVYLHVYENKTKVENLKKTYKNEPSQFEFCKTEDTLRYGS